MASRHLFTSESVTEGHPDKIADQISDAVLDALIAQDPMSRVACETLVTTGLAIVAGEISSRGYVEIPELVRRVIGRIGYDSAEFGFDSHTCAVMTTIDNQSPDIAMGVNTGGAPKTSATGAADRSAAPISVAACDASRMGGRYWPRYQPMPCRVRKPVITAKELVKISAPTKTRNRPLPVVTARMWR